MYTAREIKPGIILSFAWKAILFFFLYASALCAISVALGVTLGISFLPIGLIGTAVAFYVGFKNNSSYERLWEARRIWGAFVNASRTWGAQVSAGVQGNELAKAQLIHRHIAYVNAVRIQLRSKSIWNDTGTTAHEVVKTHHGAADVSLEELLSTLVTADEARYFLSKKNAATHLMKRQAEQVSQLLQNGNISELAHFHMMNVVQEFYNQQGAAERIKNFPFPRQYAHFSKVFVWLFILVLPFGLINEFAKLGENLIWLAVPSYMLIAWVFNTMEIVGDTSENPFENAINDVPMTAICRTIEIDLREMLEEKDVPAAITPVNHILM